MDETAIADNDTSTVAEPVWNGDTEIGKINSTDNDTDDWRNDVVN